MLENIKVSSKTNQSKLAGAIATAIRNNSTTTISCVGQYALLQAIKGLTLARRFLAEEKIEIYSQIDMEDAPRTETPVAETPAEGEAAPAAEEPRVIIKFTVTSKKVGE